jgi:hypothetical protein
MARKVPVRSVLQALHLLLVAVGLLALPSVSEPGLAGGGHVPTWQCGRHEIAVLGRDARTESPRAKSSEPEAPRGSSGGGSEPHDAVAAANRVTQSRGAVRAALLAEFDDRAVLAQAHLRVNGSANAHGALA